MQARSYVLELDQLDNFYLTVFFSVFFYLALPYCDVLLFYQDQDLKVLVQAH
jgi:hypothetical protein